MVTLPGTGFGPEGEGYLRLSYANSPENRKGLRRIRRFWRSLVRARTAVTLSDVSACAARYTAANGARKSRCAPVRRRGTRADRLRRVQWSPRARPPNPAAPAPRRPGPVARTPSLTMSPSASAPCAIRDSRSTPCSPDAARFRALAVAAAPDVRLSEIPGCARARTGTAAARSARVTTSGSRS